MPLADHNNIMRHRPLPQCRVAWLLFLLSFVEPQPAWAVPFDGAVLPTPGALCGFVAGCGQIGEIGLHVSMPVTVRTRFARSEFDAEGSVRLSVTFLDLAEIGGVLGGHVGLRPDGPIETASSPGTLFARLRLLPLPIGPLRNSFRFLTQWQHDFYAPHLGDQLPPRPQHTFSGVAGQTYGPLDIDGSLGVVLAPVPDDRPQLAAIQLGVAASLWIRRAQKQHPSSQLRLQGEALYRFSRTPDAPSHATVMLGVLGLHASGYGGGIAAGPEFVGSQTTFRMMATLQFAWGPHVRNPLADRQAENTTWTPQWVWDLLGAIDPILGGDGCVYSDPTPKRRSKKMFCIGKPDPLDSQTIVVDGGQRLAVGTHLQRLGTTLRKNDGTKVYDIPIGVQVVAKLAEYLDQLIDADENGGPSAALCEGRVGTTPPGISDGLASVHLNDQEGGSRAAVGLSIYRALLCEPESVAAGEMLELLSPFMRRRPGPWRARPNVGTHQQPPATRVQPAGGGGVAEHTRPPQLPKPLLGLTSQAKRHILQGELNRHGEATGWHHEPSAGPSTYVIEKTRREADSHGVYKAEVVIHGQKKFGISTFFPRDWSAEQVQSEIMHAFENRKPGDNPSLYWGHGRSGVMIAMVLDDESHIVTAYPLYKKGR